MSSSQGYGATGSQSGPLYGPQSLGLPAIPPTGSLFAGAGADPAAQTSTPLIAAGVSGQVWVASPPNSAAPGTESVVPLSVAAKTPSTPPIGEDGLAGERQPVRAVQGRLAVSHDSPSLAVLGSGMLGPSTQTGMYNAPQPGMNSAAQSQMYNTAQTGMYSAAQTGMYNAAQPDWNTGGLTEMYSETQPGMYNTGQLEMYSAGQPQGGMSQQQGPIAVPHSIPPTANQSGLLSSVTFIGQADSGAFPRTTSNPNNTPPPASPTMIGTAGSGAFPRTTSNPNNTTPAASPTMIGTSSGQFGQASLGTARPGDIKASPSSFKGFNPVGQDGAPVAGGFHSPTADPGGGQVSSTPIADSVLLGHLVGDEAAPRPDQPLLVNQGVGAHQGSAEVSHGTGHVSHGTGHVSHDGMGQVSHEGSGQVPSMPSVGTSDDGIGQVPSMPSVGMSDAGGQVSSTPISDSVLLGHLMGDEAAPRPDQPLPVILPNAPTSGVPKEASIFTPHAGSEDAGTLPRSKTGSTESVAGQN